MSLEDMALGRDPSGDPASTASGGTGHGVQVSLLRSLLPML